jgi:hypothetical protein
MILTLLLSSSIISSSRSFFSANAADSRNSTQTSSQESTVTGDNSIDQSSAPANDNHQPIANAGKDVEVKEGDQVILNGHKSSDPDGDKLTFLWQQVSPAKPQIKVTHSEFVKAQFKAPVVNKKSVTFLFSLTIKDPTGDSSIDTVKVKVGKAPTSMTQNLLNGKKASDKLANLQGQTTNIHQNKTKITIPQIRINTHTQPGLDKSTKSKTSSHSQAVAQAVSGPYSGGIGISWDETNILLDCQIDCGSEAEGGAESQMSGGCDEVVGCTFQSESGSGSFSFSSAHGSGGCGGTPTYTMKGSSALLDALPEIGIGSCGGIPNPPGGFVLSPNGNGFKSEGQILGFNCNPGGSSDCSENWSWSLILEPGTSPVTPPQPPPLPTPNHPPNANAGPDQTVNSGDTVTLDGTGSSDPDPGDSVASYQWSSSDPSITLSGATPSFKAPDVTKDTTLTFQLIVTDTHGAQSQPDTVDIHIKAPILTCTGTASTTKVAAAAAPSCDKIEVSVSPDSINPYPDTGRPGSEKSTITITAINSATGATVPGAKVKIQACTVVGSGGHPKDTRSGPCVQGDRPFAKLALRGTKGNPITVTTDGSGKAIITYSPPFGTDNKGKGQYYISGEDIIQATLDSNPAVKDDSKTIKVKVPGLQEMFGSASCVGGGTFTFDSQANHDCLFYGTPFTDDALLKVANEYSDRQIKCRDDPSSFACKVTEDDGHTVTTQHISGNPIPIRITALSLPWGGLLDAGPGAGIANAKLWKPPHASHNTGKQVDIGLAGIHPIDDAHRLLLREVMKDIDPAGNIVRCEGGINLTHEVASCKTIAPPKGRSNHIHFNFSS